MPAPQTTDEAGGMAVPAGLLLAQATTFSGPLPPPAILHQYNEVVPGAAERILAMAEKQSDHRRELERKVIGSDVWRANVGLIAGFAIALSAIVSGSLVAYHGQPWAGAAIGGAPVGGLVWAFLAGTKARREERESKAAAALGGRH